MIDRPVELVCTDRRTHDLRELAVVIPVRPRADLALMREQAGLPPQEMTVDERRGFGIRASMTTVEDGKRSERIKTEIAVTQARHGGWSIEVRCPTCRRAPRVTLATLEKISDGMRDRPRVEVDVSALERSH